MSIKHLRTSDLARAVGIHPNTVRLYVDWGLIPPVKRSEAGYRLFTQYHLDCLRLARMIYATQYPGKELRASGYKIIQCAVMDDWQAALEKAHQHLAFLKAELNHANQAASLLEDWVQNRQATPDKTRLAIRDVSKLLDVSPDVIRNWERNGLISVPRNAYNHYRLFGQQEIERLRIIRMLSRAGYSHMAMLRMFIELDGGNTDNLRQVLDTPRPDEDVFTASDRWLSTLESQEKLAQQVIHLIEVQIETKMAKRKGLGDI